MNTKAIDEMIDELCLANGMISDELYQYLKETENRK